MNKHKKEKQLCTSTFALNETKVSTKCQLGGHAFPVSSPQAWNKLALDIKITTADVLRSFSLLKYGLALQVTWQSSSLMVYMSWFSLCKARFMQIGHPF